MKAFSREFLGKILIFLGILILLAVFYDIIRPYFPRQPHYKLLEKLQAFFEPRSPGPVSIPETDPRQSRPVSPPSPPNILPSKDGKLTLDIYQTKDQYRLSNQWS